MSIEPFNKWQLFWLRHAWGDLQSWSSALEGGHTAHVDSIRRCSRRIRPWPRVVYLPCLGVLLSVLTVSRSSNQRLSRRRFSWRLWRTHHRSGPLQRNRADRRFPVRAGAVILAVCLKVTDVKGRCWLLSLVFTWFSCKNTIKINLHLKSPEHFAWVIQSLLDGGVKSDY